MSRRFPAPWIVEPIPGGFKVDDTGQALAYGGGLNRVWSLRFGASSNVDATRVGRRMMAGK